MNTLKVGQVVKFTNAYGDKQYERIFAIGQCPRHKGLNHIRITTQGRIPDTNNPREDCGCLGDIVGGVYPLSKKERGV